MNISSDSDTVAVTVVIPTFRRCNDLRRTLQYLRLCKPAPSEVIIHVDAGDTETPAMISREFPDITVMHSDERQGPGGGRNRLIRKAENETVVSLDDDSWPMQLNFFLHAWRIIDEQRRAAVVGCEVIESDGAAAQIEPPKGTLSEVDLVPAGGFVGCGAIVRRSAFLEISGYLPLANAYGMEEADVSLQLVAKDWELMKARGLKVFHACDRAGHHASPAINAAQIRNTALLAFLRYPVVMWPKGLLQTANRVFYSIRRRRFRGILKGVSSILPAVFTYCRYRQKVPRRVIEHIQQLQRETAKGHPQ